MCLSEMFLDVGICHWKFSCYTAFGATLNFGISYFHLSCYVFISFLIFSLTHWLFTSMLYNLHIFANFPVFSW